MSGCTPDRSAGTRAPYYAAGAIELAGRVGCSVHVADRWIRGLAVPVEVHRACVDATRGRS